MFKRLLDRITVRPIWDLYRTLRPTKPLFMPYPRSVRYRLLTIDNDSEWSKWKTSLTIVTPDGITIYPYQVEITPIYLCTPNEISWFGRPHKYKSGDNDILIHSEIKGRWQVVELRMSKGNMQKLVRALKAIGSEEQITAYRRHRPYIRYGPLPFHPAHQDIYGAWDVNPDTLTFYLTPVAFVILDGENVLRVIDLKQIQKIQALKRLDAPDEDGIVRFEIEGEKLAFVVSDHEHLANQIAEASKRSLEDPIERKRKKKYDDAYAEDFEG